MGRRYMARRSHDRCTVRRMSRRHAAATGEEEQEPRLPPAMRRSRRSRDRRR